MKVLHLDNNHPTLLQQLAEAGFSNTENYTATKEEVEQFIGDYNGIVIRSRFKIDKSFLDAAIPDFIIFEIHHIGRDRHQALHRILKMRGYDCQVCANYDVNAHCQLRVEEIYDKKLQEIAFGCY